MKHFSRLLCIALLSILACQEEDESPTPTTVDQATLLTDGQALNVAFTETIDTLFYKIEVDTPAVIEVNLQGDATGIQLELLGESNNQLERFTFRDMVMVEYGPVAAGTYYLRLNDLLSSNSEQTFSMTYSLDKSDVYELNNTEGEAESISLDQSYNAYLRDENDVDYFKFTLTESAFVEVMVDSFPKALTNMKVEILGAANELSQTGYDGEAIALKTNPLPAGDYRLLFSSSTGVSSTNPYAFTVTANEVEGVFGNTTYDAAYSLKSGEEITTLMEVAGDKYFKLDVQECGVIDVTIDPVPNGLNLTAYLQTEKGQETYDATSYQGKEGEPIYISYGPVSASDSYYLRIRESGKKISEETFKINYSLDTTDRYECNDTPALADQNDITVDPDIEYKAYIRTGTDYDWYRFEMDSAGVVSVELQTPSDMDKMFVNIFDAGNSDSQVDYEEVKAGQTGRVVAGPLEAGTHYIRINSREYSFSAGDQSRDPYTFTLSLDYSKYEINNTFEQAKDITSIIDEGSIEERIYPKNLYSYKYSVDVDYYAFTVRETTTLQISATALKGSSYTYLTLYSRKNDNSEITTDSYSDRYGNNQETIQRTLTFEPGEYYIKISNSNTSEEPYQLSIKTVQ